MTPGFVRRPEPRISGLGRRLDNERWRPSAPTSIAPWTWSRRALRLAGDAARRESGARRRPRAAARRAATVRRGGVPRSTRRVRAAGTPIAGRQDGRRLHAGLADRPGRHGHGLAGASAATAASKGSAAVKFLNLSLLGAAVARRRAVPARGQHPRAPHAPAHRAAHRRRRLARRASRISCSNTSTASRSIGTATSARSTSRRACGCSSTCSAAVAHAHANLIVHRDLKPSNVLVTQRDGQVKLLDFGIAKLLEDDAEARRPALTREGGAALTPEFAAPEQVTGGTGDDGDRRLCAGRAAVCAARPGSIRRGSAPCRRRTS